MLRELNFNTKNKPLWIVSDPHFNHDRDFLWGKRGFASVTEHDTVVKQRWNERVAKDDNVIHLGDHVFRDGKGELARETLHGLNGHIYMLWGNHNSGVKVLYREALTKAGFEPDKYEVYPIVWENKVTFLGDYVKGFINGVPYVASHFPFHIWDEMHHGAIALSGHSHSSDEKSNPDCLDCKRVDCGIDNFGGPISFEEVMDIMNSKRVQIVDHHDKRTVSGR